MTKKVWYGQELTRLEVYVGTMTQFEENGGRLRCRDIILVVKDRIEAMFVCSTNYPEWDLQTLTPLSSLSWFGAIHLAPDCPQIASLREWVMSDIEAVVAV